MKKIRLLTAILLVGMGMNIHAAKELWIYENNATIRTVPVPDVDSIGFTSLPELLLFQGNFPSYRNNVNNIDSVVFMNEKELLPEVSMFYSEFVPAGGELRVKGKHLFSPKVYFYAENGTRIQSPNVRTSDNGTMMYVDVPEGVTHSRPIVVETQAGTATSKVLFRDKRNIIIDFDEYWPTVSGTMVPGGTWVPDFRPKWKEELELLKLLPYGFKLPEGCDGLYDQINRIEYAEGGYISYWVERGGRIPQKPLIGEFISLNIKDLVLKFEVYVPKEYPINGIYADISFSPKGNNGGYTGGRDHVRGWPSERTGQGDFLPPLLLRTKAPGNSPCNEPSRPGGQEQALSKQTKTKKIDRRRLL